MGDELSLVFDEDGRKLIGDLGRGHWIRPGNRDAEDRGVGYGANGQPRQQQTGTDVQAKIACDFLCDRRLLDQFGVRLRALHAARSHQRVENRQLRAGLVLIGLRARMETAGAACNQFYLRRVLARFEEREQRDRYKEAGEDHQEQASPAPQNLGQAAQVEFARHRIRRAGHDIGRKDRRRRPGRRETAAEAVHYKPRPIRRPTK